MVGAESSVALDVFKGESSEPLVLNSAVTNDEDTKVNLFSQKENGCLSPYQKKGFDQNKAASSTIVVPRSSSSVLATQPNAELLPAAINALPPNVVRVQSNNIVFLRHVQCILFYLSGEHGSMRSSCARVSCAAAANSGTRLPEVHFAGNGFDV